MPLPFFPVSLVCGQWCVWWCAEALSQSQSAKSGCIFKTPHAHTVRVDHPPHALSWPFLGPFHDARETSSLERRQRQSDLARSCIHEWLVAPLCTPGSAAIASASQQQVSRIVHFAMQRGKEMRNLFLDMATD
ncbi:hypothetical protein GQ54DRAFT_41673 [Martensiomyces pterosporus]|nr:hypothetical protein GQ54DRAFT_41673 [Martensiomyces pterosporus]